MLLFQRHGGNSACIRGGISIYDSYNDDEPKGVLVDELIAIAIRPGEDEEVLTYLVCDDSESNDSRTINV